MEGQVELATSGQTEQDIANQLSLRLGEGRLTLEGIRAGVAGGTNLSPMEIEVAIGIGSIAGTADWLSGLAPHTGGGVRVFIAIGIHHRQDNPVKVLQQFRVGSKVLHQLMDHIQSSSMGDPFASMDTSIQEDNILAGLTIAIGDSDGLDVTILIRLASHLDGYTAGIGSSQFIQVGIDLGMTMERLEANAAFSGSQVHQPLVLVLIALLTQRLTEILVDHRVVYAVLLQQVLESLLILGLDHHATGRVQGTGQVKEVVCLISGQTQQQLLLKSVASIDVVDLVAVDKKKSILSCFELIFFFRVSRALKVDIFKISY